MFRTDENIFVANVSRMYMASKDSKNHEHILQYYLSYKT